MDMNKLCEDLWNRFCKMDDCLKVVWMEEQSTWNMIVLASKDLNDWMRLGYGSNNFVGFFEDLKRYEDVCKNFDPGKKWICVSSRRLWIRSTDSLIEIDARYCCLLREFKHSRMRKLLGYTDEEIHAILTELKDLSELEMTKTWNNFMESKGYRHEY